MDARGVGGRKLGLEVEGGHGGRELGHGVQVRGEVADAPHSPVHHVHGHLAHLVIAVRLAEGLDLLLHVSQKLLKRGDSDFKDLYSGYLFLEGSPEVWSSRGLA